MSAINFKLDIGRASHDGAECVVITFDGKFLPATDRNAWRGPSAA